MYRRLTDSLAMNTAYRLLKSESLDEQQHTEILVPPEFPDMPDIESSSDDELDAVPGDTSAWKAAINLVSYMEGAGFLALPYALKEGGISALVGFIIIPIILWYMGTILIGCLYDEDEQGRKIRARSGYKDLGDVFVAKYGGYMVSGVFNLELFLLSVSYIVLCGSVMHHAFPSVPITEVMWICIAGGLVLPTTFLKSLSHIAWLSVFSMLALVAVVVAVVWYGAENTNEWDLGTILFWDAEGMVMSVSTILFSYGAFTIIPSVEKSMAEKNKFSCALSLANGLSLIMKLYFSVCAFLSFGVNTNVVILNNLPPGPVHITVACCFVSSCIVSYVLILFPVFESCHDSLTARIQNDKIPSFLTYAVVRVTIVLLTVMVGILIPNFFIIVSFLGSISSAFLSYIFPFVLHLKLKYKQLKIYQVCIACFFVFLGVIQMIVGTGVSVKSLIDFYKQ